MVADLHGGAVGGLSKVVGAGSGKGGIGFAIEGTSSDPKFIPDVGGVVGGIAKGAVGNVVAGQGAATQAPVQAVGGLLGRKKK